MGNNKKIVIVDSMTNEQIMELLRDDFIFLQHKISCLQLRTRITKDERVERRL